MASPEDLLLMRSISAQADRAEEIKPHTVDLAPLSQRLHEEFPHRSAAEIEEKCKDVWRDRHLVWTGMN